MYRTEELLKESIAAIERANRSKKYALEVEKLSSIDWETDTSKMEFYKIRNTSIKGMTIKGVEYIDTPTDRAEVRYFDDMCKLIDLVKSGSKIIPPLSLTKHKILDGVKVGEETNWFEGCYKASLTHHLNIKQMPVVMFETKEYRFRTEKWIIQHDGESVTFQSISDDQKYSFDLSCVSISEESSFGDILAIKATRY